MGAPTVNELVGATFFYWQDIGVKVKVKQPVRLSKDGRVMSLITVTYDQMPDSKQILQGEFNYSSLANRKAVAKQLADIAPDPPWSRILESVCQEVLTNINKGEPVEVIEEWQGGPPTFLIKPFIPEFQPTILYGKGGKGKSTLALLMYFGISLPWHDNPLGWEIGTEAKKGLYLDWEADKSSIAYQRKRLEEGIGMPLPPINYLSISTLLPDSIDYIRRAMDETGAEFIVVDSLAGACGGDLNASEPSTRFFNALRMLTTTTLIVAHPPKGGKESESSVSGSAIFENRARSVWECKSVMEEGSSVLDMGLFHRKVNVGTRLKPMGLRFIYTEDSIEVENISVKMIPEFKKSQSIQTQVYQYVCEMPGTITEIVEYLHPVKRNTVEVAIHRLLKDGAIVALSDDRFAQSAQAKNPKRKKVGHG